MTIHDARGLGLDLSAAVPLKTGPQKRQQGEVDRVWENRNKKMTSEYPGGFPADPEDGEEQNQ
jgi:hypothetical protein